MSRKWNRFRLLAAVPLLSIQVAAASAEALDITGTYGNEAGCKFARTQEPTEDMMLLDAGQYRTYAALCSFVQVIRVNDFTRVMTSICASEGEVTETVEMLRLQKDPFGADAWTLFNAAGDDWGFFPKCQPARD